MSNTGLIESVNSGELARCLFDESSDALIVFDPQSLRLVDVNPVAQKLTKRTRKTLLKHSITELFASDDSNVFGEFLDSCQNTRIYHSRESHQLIREDGGMLEVNVSVSRLHTSPSPLGIISVRDVSRRKTLESDLKQAQTQLQNALNEKTWRLNATSDELRQSEQRLRALLDDVDAIIWEATLPLIEFTFVSKQAETILGYPVTHWIEHQDFWFNHLHPDDAECSLAECKEATSRGVDHELNYRMKSADGRDVWLRDNVHVVKDDQGEPIKLRGVMIDVTQRVEAEQERVQLDQELRKSERQLAHVARLSTMGEMVAGISHEINQPLSAISNFASAALQTLKKAEDTTTSPLKQWIKQIGEQAIRCGDIVRRLRGFTRKNDSGCNVLNVRQAIIDSQAMIGELHGENRIDFIVDIPDDLRIQFNDVEFQQVLVNLIRNACDAFVHRDEVRPQVRIAATTNGGTIRITVEDNGPGISDDVYEMIFDPFFTTRKDGMGMGLGISRSIIRNHMGSLSLDGGYTDGARFCIDLPMATDLESVDRD